MRQFIGLVLMTAFSLTGGCGSGGEEIVCGPGTVELDGVCIPGGNSQVQGESDITCEPGTVEIDGECISDSRVGNDNNGNPSNNGNPVNGDCEGKDLQIDRLRVTELPPAGLFVRFRALDCDGKGVPALDESQIEIINDNTGKPFGAGNEGSSQVSVKPVTDFSLMTVLALDMSESVHATGYVEDVIDAANTFIELLTQEPEGDYKHHVALVAFGSTDETRLIADFTQDTEFLKSTLQQLSTMPSFGSTDLYGAYKYGLELLSGQSPDSNLGNALRKFQASEQMLVFVTDGVHEAGDPRTDRGPALAAKSNEDVTIYTVGMSDEIDAESLTELATSADHFFSMENPELLKGGLEEIAGEMTNTTMSYYVAGVCTPVTKGTPTLTINISSQATGGQGSATVEYVVGDLNGDIAACNPQEIITPWAGCRLEEYRRASHWETDGYSPGERDDTVRRYYYDERGALTGVGGSGGAMVEGDSYRWYQTPRSWAPGIIPVPNPTETVPASVRHRLTVEWSLIANNNNSFHEDNSLFQWSGAYGRNESSGHEYRFYIHLDRNTEGRLIHGVKDVWRVELSMEEVLERDQSGELNVHSPPELVRGINEYHFHYLNSFTPSDIAELDKNYPEPYSGIQKLSTDMTRDGSLHIQTKLEYQGFSIQGKNFSFGVRHQSTPFFQSLVPIWSESMHNHEIISRNCFDSYVEGEDEEGPGGEGRGDDNGSFNTPENDCACKSMWGWGASGTSRKIHTLCPIGDEQWAQEVRTISSFRDSIEIYDTEGRIVHIGEYADDNNGNSLSIVYGESVITVLRGPFAVGGVPNATVPENTVTITGAEYQLNEEGVLSSAQPVVCVWPPADGSMEPFSLKHCSVHGTPKAIHGEMDAKGVITYQPSKNVTYGGGQPIAGSRVLTDSNLIAPMDAYLRFRCSDGQFHEILPAEPLPESELPEVEAPEEPECDCICYLDECGSDGEPVLGSDAFQGKSEAEIICPFLEEEPLCMETINAMGCSSGFNFFNLLMLPIICEVPACLGVLESMKVEYGVIIQTVCQLALGGEGGGG